MKPSPGAHATLLSILAFSLATAASAAQGLAPGSTAADAAQQAKLRSDVGTWQCIAVPASGKPQAFTEREEGNWFVSRATGALPRTSYERWSHALQAYVLISIFDSGASDVERSPSPDPDNGIWTPVWPPLDDKGRKRFDVEVTRSGDVIRAATHFYDANGNTQSATTTCTKRP